MSLRCHCWLVAPPNVPIPEDSIGEYDIETSNPACSNVVCTSCGTKVMHDNAESVRKYHCACTTWDATVPSALAPNDDEAGVPWQCGGHRVRDLPTTIDGVEVSDETNVIDLFRIAVTRATSPSRLRSTSMRWLRRVMRILEGTSVEPKFARAACEAFVDHDPRLRWVALQLAPYWLNEADARSAGEHLHEALRSRAELFVDVPDPRPDMRDETATLEDRAMIVLAQLGSRFRPAEPWKPMLRAFVLRRPQVERVLGYVAQFDMNWFLDSSGQILDAGGPALPLFHAIAIGAPIADLAKHLGRLDMRIVRAAASSNEPTVGHVFKWMLDHDRAWAEEHLGELLQKSHYGHAYTELLPGLLARGTILSDGVKAVLRDKCLAPSFIQGACREALLAQDRDWVEAQHATIPEPPKPPIEPPPTNPPNQPVSSPKRTPAHVLKWISPPGPPPLRGILPVHVPLAHALRILRGLCAELGPGRDVPFNASLVVDGLRLDEVNETNAFVSGWLGRKRGRVSWSDGMTTIAVAFRAVHYNSGPEGEPTDEIQCEVEASGLAGDGRVSMTGVQLFDRTCLTNYQVEGAMAKVIAIHFFTLGKELASWEVF